MTAAHQSAVMGAIAAMTHVSGDVVNIDRIAEALPLSRKAISQSVGKLVHRAYVERLEAGAYRLTLTGREALEKGKVITSAPVGPRSTRVFKDTLAKRAWTAIRLAKRFTMGELLVLVQRPGDRNPEAALQSYLSRLTRCGYLTVLDKGATPQWRLVRDTGPLEPAWLGTRGGIKDRNTQEFFTATTLLLSEVRSCPA
jgi:hypothetical protein